MKIENVMFSNYIYDEQIRDIVPFSSSDLSNEESKIWDSLLPKIKKIIEQLKPQLSKITDENASIILLFLHSKHLSQHNFFEVLPGSTIRKIVSPDKKKQKVFYRYNPVISVAYPDIASLKTENKGELGQKEKSWNNLLYNTFTADPRIKFLDSSIWHRYVPVTSLHDSFATRFKTVLEDIISYYQDGLYYTTAANVTLEFQLRMLKNSFLAKMSERGHSEVVTPFKFHSETQMKRKLRDEMDFLTRIWSGHESLISALKWRLLIVDDQAGNQQSDDEEKTASLKKKKWVISSLPSTKDYKVPDCKVSKQELIERPFVKLFKRLDIENYRKSKFPKLAIDVPPTNKDEEKSFGVIKFALDSMKEKTYDIIFLDYLLGDKSENNPEREYGFNFILDLLEDNRLSRPRLRRDVTGKYWILPISSFPHALPDKIKQLGISHLHEIWHISQGGDPITTPYLFAYNLLRFIKQKIGDFFLYPSALRRFLNQALIHEDPDNDIKWIKYLLQSIKNTNETLKILFNLELDNYSSPFIKSIEKFLANQHEYKSMLSIIQDILSALIENEDEDLTIEKKEILNEKMKELEVIDIAPDFKEVLVPLRNRILIRINENFQKAKERIENVKKTGNNKLRINNLSLTNIPEEIEGCIEVNMINLSVNNLSSLPRYFKNLPILRTLNLSKNKFSIFPTELYNISSLQELDLSNNQITKFDGDELLSKLPKLSYLNLEGNPIPIEKKVACTKKEVKRLCKEMPNKETFDEEEHRDVFISYSRRDENWREYIKKTVEELKQLEVSVFFDEENRISLRGEFMPDYFRDIINHCDYFIPFLSKNYIHSKHCKHELQVAKTRRFNLDRTFILPIRLDTAVIKGIDANTIFDWRLYEQEISPQQLALEIKQKLDLFLNK